jgi:glycosyltransferase involved in cell wall biosynthesis
LPASLSIVIPAYNEERRLPPTLDRILEYLKSADFADWEVLVVNDGSRDRTVEVVKRYIALDGRIRLLENPGNRGKGYAVRNGMLASLKEWALITDADLSAPIEELSRLTDAARLQSAQVAIGSRAIDRSLVSVHQTAFREFSGRFFNIVMRIVTGLPFHDTQCGFKLFSHEAAHAIFARQQIEGFGFDVEDLMIARTLGFKAIEVGVRWANVDGTKVSLMSGLRSFSDILLVRWYQVTGRYRS